MFFAELEVIGYANAGPVLGLAASGGAAKRILQDDFTLGLVATLGDVADASFDWDLDGDGVYEVLGGAATMEVSFTNIDVRTVLVRDTSTWQVEALEIGACPPDVYVAPEGQGGDEYPYDTPAMAANSPDSVWPLVIPGSRVHLLPGAYNYSFTIGEGVHLMADDPSHGATIVTNDNTRRVFEVSGEGVLLLGDSGVGKSETAIELVKRGHRLIADDAVEIKRVSAKTLVGTAPELIRHYIELRGIGIVDVRRIFGMGAVKFTEKIDLVINLEPWQAGKNYERLGLDTEYQEIMGINVPAITVPVKPGRNLAIIIEIAAINNRQKKMGYNAVEEINKRIMGQGSDSDFDR